MPLRGWSAAYPETTGYLIETLLDYALLRQQPRYAEAALGCADWLCSIQQPAGSFAGGMSGQTTRPSVFNTAQILFGLARVVRTELPASVRYANCLSALQRGVQWLSEQLADDGSWRAGAYVPGYIPAYYTRAVWGWLDGGATLRQTGAWAESEWQDLLKKARAAIHFYAGRFLYNTGISGAGFSPKQVAFTHTLAYALEGFWHCSRLLEMPELAARTLVSVEALGTVRTRAGRTAGRYTPDWSGDYTFLCPTGNAQLSVLFYEIAEKTGNEHYRSLACSFLTEILPFQTRSGALPGSAPVWGPYMRFRYPNWAVKFFLDALRSWFTS